MPILDRFTLIIPAAGTSSRFGTNKLLAPLGGVPVISRTLSAFLGHPSLAGIVISASQPNALRQACVKVIKEAESRGIPVTFAPGGASRAQSVLNAVEAAPSDVEWIAVHDAARPLVSRALIDQTLIAAIEHGAATPAMPVTLTIKESASALPAAVLRTIPRQTLWAVQTPQVMRRAAYLAAIGRCPIRLDLVTDDTQLLELAAEVDGEQAPVWLVPGEERNLKLTTAMDLIIAEQLIAPSEASSR